ncbi:class I SAM-dependent methyltransferase [Nitratireductor sp. XY-223]|uniref:class I SAM-dependent methyltransferase n=1 Tax=Nitratireductor sp. XY-223 TaxID=2561926 RepID=UPI0010AA7BFD|nr:class I SAM-dependent methyltransferase [Nitratireductor sp. XY-223]
MTVVGAIETLIESLLEYTQDSPRSGSGLDRDLKGILKRWPPGADKYAATLAYERLGLDRPTIIDFGCGKGHHQKLLEEAGFEWKGLDYSDSLDPDAMWRSANHSGSKITLYSGKAIPYADASVDAFWSWQSLEHVHFPETTFKEFARCLRRGGILVGSVPFFVPYHAQSTVNYSPYGFYVLAENAGMTVTDIVPGDDGLSILLVRYLRLLGVPEEAIPRREILNQGGLFMKALAKKYESVGLSEDNLNSALAQFCGHFRFFAVKR